MPELYLALLLLLVSECLLVREAGAGRNSRAPNDASRQRQRRKRGLIELAGVIQCSTGRLATGYMMYGCYCGLGGQGWPQDQADWCCHRHDCCYGNAETLGCQTKTRRYKWTCRDKMADCDSAVDLCEAEVCRCDSQVASCLELAPFNPKYALWPDFLCGGQEPSCDLYS